MDAAHALTPNPRVHIPPLSNCTFKLLRSKSLADTGLQEGVPVPSPVFIEVEFSQPVLY
jgi:hypothetical protein